MSSPLQRSLLGLGVSVALLGSAWAQDDPQALYAAANEDMSAGRFPEAIAKLEQIAQLLSNNPAAREPLRFAIGVAQFRGALYPQAIESFRGYLAEFPQGPNAGRASLGLGRALLATQDEANRDEAIRALENGARDPQVRSEASAALGQLLLDMGREADALKVFGSLSGSEVVTAQQTTAAVEVIKILANLKRLDQLVPYLDNLPSQAGVRNSIGWFVNQMVLVGDEQAKSENYETALALYRAIPARRQILDIQSAALEGLKADKVTIEEMLKVPGQMDMATQDILNQTLTSITETVDMGDKAMKFIEEMPNFDAGVLMRRGRCLYYLNRYAEALICFSNLRENYPDSDDAETASYSEIFIYSQLEDRAKVDELATAFLQKYPESKNRELVSNLVIDTLVRQGNWEEVRLRYQQLIQDYPDSKLKDQYEFNQGIALIQLRKFEDAAALYEKFLEQNPESDKSEEALFRLILCNFFSGDYKATLESCNRYEAQYPGGVYWGEVLYRLAFIDRNDPEVTADSIVNRLNEYITQHPDDEVNGAMLALIGEIYNGKVSPPDKAKALEYYQRAALEGSPNNEPVIRNGLDEATKILQGEQRWADVASLHNQIIERFPGTSLALSSVQWVAKAQVREGKPEEAAKLISEYLKQSISDPSKEDVEPLIDELVQVLLPPRRQRASANLEEIDARLQELLNAAAEGKVNGTSNARLIYARAVLAQQMQRPEIADAYLKAVAESNTDVNELSPILLASFGEILRKNNNYEKARAMFERLANRYGNSPYSSAGGVGLAQILLDEKKNEEALSAFNAALETMTSMFAYQPAVMGRLKATFALGRYDNGDGSTGVPKPPEAENAGAEGEAKPAAQAPAEPTDPGSIYLAERVIGDRSFRGPLSAEAYQILAESWRAKAESQAGDDKADSLKRAHAYYQRIYLAFQNMPELCAKAYMQAYLILKELGDNQLATETLQKLTENPNLADTPEASEAKTLLP